MKENERWMQGLGLLSVMAAAGICAVQSTHIRKQADEFFKNATDTLNKTVQGLLGKPPVKSAGETAERDSEEARMDASMREGIANILGYEAGKSTAGGFPC